MTVRILRGDCRHVLRRLEADSVHAAVTSPPYWGLRDYGIEPTVWGGDETCEHDWGDELVVSRSGGTGSTGLMRDGRAEEARQQNQERKVAASSVNASQGSFCRCGAWRGTFGLEPTYQLYVAHAVEVFREVRRVLRPDGTLWLNLGDSYASGTTKGNSGYGTSTLTNGEEWQDEAPRPRGRPAPGATARAGRCRGTRDTSNAGKASYAFAGLDGPLEQPNRMPQPGLKPKDLVGIPWRVALALQDDGWWLRSDIIWHKPNPMPESVTDRPTKAHEYLFLLTKADRYFYDADAIAEPSVTLDPDHPSWRPSAEDIHANGRRVFAAKRDGTDGTNQAFRSLPRVRNKRTVWTVTTCAYADAHFATFPPALVEPCVQASTSERGCCVKCGAGWARVVAPSARYAQVLGQSYHDHEDDVGAGMMQHRGVNRQNAMVAAGIAGKEVETVGWYPTCRCDGLDRLPPYPPAPKAKTADAMAAWREDCAAVTENRRAMCSVADPIKTVPAVVLDPFGGSGTTAMVADRLRRDSVLIELNPAYADMARRRLSNDGGMFASVAAE